MKIFIGSSKEAIEHLDTVCDIIESYGYEPVPWNKPGLFLPGTFTVQRLIEIAKSEVQASILIYSPDDDIWYRGNQTAQPRDNVLFENGIFSGILGLEKAIIIKAGKSKIPSDLSGVTYVDLEKISRARLEIKNWLNIISKEKNLFLTLNKDIKFDTEDFKYFIGYQEDMRDSVIDFVSEIYWAYDLEDHDLIEFLTLVLTKFINNFIGINDARFTIRQYNDETDCMDTLITTRQDAIPGPIPLNKPNLITESAIQNKPLIYSENKHLHFNTSNNSIKKGVYQDYVSYCLLETNENKPIYSICLDVKNPTAINRMKALVHSLVFEIICVPIIEKFEIEIDKLNNNKYA